jgi:translation elongation factor EF-1beta
MLLYRLSVAKSDLIDMQMSSLSVSMNVFDDESAETDQIDKKIRSKNDVQQLNVDRIV